jgi:hypothetical protein
MSNVNNNQVTMPVEINLTLPDGSKVQYTEQVVGIPGSKIEIERLLG